MKRGRCRGCGAEILWITTKAGKAMTCNPVPVMYWEKSKAKGKVVTQNGLTLSCNFEGNPDDATGLGYISHFSTCPKATEFRR